MSEVLVTTLGTRILKNTKYIPKGMLTESVIGAQYVLEIKTKGVINPEDALSTFKSKLKEKFNVEMLYGEVVNDRIMIQIEGSPFVWSAVLLFLPQILAVVGVVVALITVYLVVSEVPSWMYALGAIAITLIMVLPRVLPAIFLEGTKKD